MGRIEVPLDAAQQFAALQRQVAEQGRRTIPGAARLSQRSAGAVAYRVRAAGNIYPFAGGINVRVIDLTATVIPGRLYQVSVRAGLWVDGAGDSMMDSRITYTVDGSQPVVGSTPMRTISTLVGQFGSVREASLDALFPVPLTCTTLRTLFYVNGTGGGGRTYGVYSDIVTNMWQPTMWITDMGTPAGTGTDY